MSKNLTRRKTPEKQRGFIQNQDNYYNIPSNDSFTENQSKLLYSQERMRTIQNTPVAFHYKNNMRHGHNESFDKSIEVSHNTSYHANTDRSQ